MVKSGVFVALTQGLYDVQLGIYTFLTAYSPQSKAAKTSPKNRLSDRYCFTSSVKYRNSESQFLSYVHTNGFGFQQIHLLYKLNYVIFF